MHVKNVYSYKERGDQLTGGFFSGSQTLQVSLTEGLLQHRWQSLRKSGMRPKNLCF